MEHSHNNSKHCINNNIKYSSIDVHIFIVVGVLTDVVCMCDVRESRYSLCLFIFLMSILHRMLLWHNMYV